MLPAFAAARRGRRAPGAFGYPFLRVRAPLEAFAAATRRRRRRTRLVGLHPRRSLAVLAQTRLPLWTARTSMHKQRIVSGRHGAILPTFADTTRRRAWFGNRWARLVVGYCDSAAVNPGTLVSTTRRSWAWLGNLRARQLHWVVNSGAVQPRTRFQFGTWHGCREINCLIADPRAFFCIRARSGAAARRADNHLVVRAGYLYAGAVDPVMT